MQDGTVRRLRKMVRVIEREVDLQLKGDVKCCGVSLLQCHTLLEIEEMGTSSIQDLSQRLSLDKSTVSRTVDGLVHMGVINRKTDPENRRFLMISLTTAGKSACRGIHQICDRFYSRLLADIPKDKVMTVLEGVTLFTTALRENRNRFDPECQGTACAMEEQNGY